MKACIVFNNKLKTNQMKGIILLIKKLVINVLSKRNISKRIIMSINLVVEQNKFNFFYYFRKMTIQSV